MYIMHIYYVFIIINVYINYYINVYINVYIINVYINVYIINVYINVYIINVYYAHIHRQCIFVAEVKTSVIIDVRPHRQSFLINRYHGNAKKAQNTSEIVALMD